MSETPDGRPAETSADVQWNSANPTQRRMTLANFPGTTYGSGACSPTREAETADEQQAAPLSDARQIVHLEAEIRRLRGMITEYQDERVRLRVALAAHEAEHLALHTWWQPQRRRALSLLHQIYDLDIDARDEHMEAKARALLADGGWRVAGGEQEAEG